jgi:hypothetical protein
MIATPGIGMGTTIANHREKNGAFDTDLSLLQKDPLKKADYLS